MRQEVCVIGGGLAGVEAAWQAARMGANVVLYEMRPVKQTPAHRTDKLAEIVGEHVTKGSMIYVEGTIKYEKYINKNGVEVNTTQIVCDEMTILKRPDKEKPVKYEGLPKDEDLDTPF